jgi:hypothetical protein
MPKLAILIAASATQAFYAQIAALDLAISKLSWTRWEPTIYAFFGDHDAPSDDLLRRWLPYLHRVELARVSASLNARDEMWAQSDALMRMAPRDADVLLALDADTLPVHAFEEVLDRVMATDEIAGVMAHTCFPPARSPLQDWLDVSRGIVTEPLSFEHFYSLVSPEREIEHRAAPFYVNGGVVFFSQKAFTAFARPSLDIRAQLMERMEFQDFTSQVAFTLTIAQERLRTWELPMRYNFPNDPRAELLQAAELDHIVIHHYQHRGHFDRHRILASEEEYARFLAQPLSGVNLRFQQAVHELLGEKYPFPLAA